jgi:hypothetical protein
MSRNPKLRLKFSEQSLLDHLQEMYLALADKIAKCNRQLSIMVNMINSPSDAITLQNVMANVEKAIATCNSQRIEIIKIQKDVISLLKKEDKKKLEKSDATSSEQMIALQRQFAEIRKQKNNIDGDF